MTWAKAKIRQVGQCGDNDDSGAVYNLIKEDEGGHMMDTHHRIHLTQVY